jgi:tellurite resistance protein TehA-like permease
MDDAEPVRAVGTIARAVRRVDPVWFAMVMATGIVSAALRPAGPPGPATALLVIAGAGFVIVAAATGWRAALFPGDLRADLGRPDRALILFTFVAACGVLGDGLAGAGHRAVAAVLAGATAPYRVAMGAASISVFAA